MGTLDNHFITYVRNAIDFTVAQEGGQYPVMSSILVQAGIATWSQLDDLEYMGHIKSYEVDVPSVLVKGKMVKSKAYYTERLVPSYVKQ